MNDLYTKTIEVDGVVYHYDPDQDIYYRRYQDLSPLDKYGWIWFILGLAALVAILEYVR